MCIVTYVYSTDSDMYTYNVGITLTGQNGIDTIFKITDWLTCDSVNHKSSLLF